MTCACIVANNETPVACVNIRQTGAEPVPAAPPPGHPAAGARRVPAPAFNLISSRQFTQKATMDVRFKIPVESADYPEASKFVIEKILWKFREGLLM